MARVNERRIRAGVTSLLLLASGCAAERRPPAADLPVRAPAAPHGIVGLRFLPAPEGSDAITQTPDLRFVHPKARTELFLPDYPEAALAARVAPFFVALRIRIDPLDGRVTGVLPSPIFASSTGAFEREFQLAAERAVRLWRFTPGRIERLEGAGEREGELRRVVDIQPIAVFYDVRFDFEIVNGRPSVTTP